MADIKPLNPEWLYPDGHAEPFQAGQGHSYGSATYGIEGSVISAGDARDYRYGVASVLGEQLASRPEVNTSSAAYELGRADARRRLEQGARLVRFIAAYISTSRNLGPEYRAELERAVLLLSGEDGEFDGNRRYEFGIIPEGETGGRAYCDYGS